MEPKQLRASALRSWLSLTRQVFQAPPAASPAPDIASVQADTTTAVKKSQRKGDATLEAAAAAFKKYGPLPTRLMLAKLPEFGVTPGGKIPLASLSTALSKSPDFTMDKQTGGWVHSEQL